MTENEIKEMLVDIINNGAEYEYKRLYECNDYGCSTCRYNDHCGKFEPYKLGDEIHPDWEYRKVEKYIVFYNMNMDLKIGLKSKHPNLKEFEFEGSKEECEKILERYEEMNEPSGFIRGLIEDLGIKI